MRILLPYFSFVLMRFFGKIFSESCLTLLSHVTLLDSFIDVVCIVCVFGEMYRLARHFRWGRGSVLRCLDSCRYVGYLYVAYLVSSVVRLVCL
jgi:hypothetical protein